MKKRFSTSEENDSFPHWYAVVAMALKVQRWNLSFSCLSTAVVGEIHMLYVYWK